MKQTKSYFGSPAARVPFRSPTAMPFVAFEWKHASAALRKAMAAASSVASRQNRFDLIRLAAAVQVMLSHCFSHLGYGDTAFAASINLFPGVHESRRRHSMTTA